MDTVLRKVNPVLFKSFGVYLVLVIANCVIIAVPLLMASNEYNYFETFMLSLGAGGGFLLALYLMSSVSERVELAKVPPSFKGLPIAFIVAGQFAMAFLGFFRSAAVLIGQCRIFVCNRRSEKQYGS